MNSSDYVLTEEEALELLAFLVASAETCLRESPDYGPYRLISAALRLVQFWPPRAEGPWQRVLENLSQQMQVEGAMRNQNPDRFADFLADCNREVAREIKRRYGRETSKSK